jgi:cleavage stimulation factor subunit 3
MELLEAKKEYAEVHAAYERFLETLRGHLEKLEAKDNASSEANGPNNPNNMSNNGLHTHADAGSFVATQQSSNSDDKPPRSRELAERRTEYGLVWIMYMRFARRAETLASTRAVFAKARKDRWTPWEVYEAAGKPRLSLAFSPSADLPPKHWWSITLPRRQLWLVGSLKRV